MKEKIIIVKLGGSVITHKGKNPPEVNFKALNRICTEIKNSLNKRNFKLIVVHGAGCFGHVLAKSYDITNPNWHDKKVHGAVKIRQNMEELNYKVIDSFVKQNLNAISIQPSASSIMENKKIVNFPWELVEKYIKYDFIPITYGDVVLDKITGLDILSGDQIIYYLAKYIKPNIVIIGGDVDGVFSSDPKFSKDAKLIPLLKFSDFDEKQTDLSGSKYTDVTGGMKGKIKELLKIAQNDIPVKIVNATLEGVFEKALLGQECKGTLIIK